MIIKLIICIKLPKIYKIKPINGKDMCLHLIKIYQLVKIKLYNSGNNLTDSKLVQVIIVIIMMEQGLVILVLA